MPDPRAEQIAQAAKDLFTDLLVGPEGLIGPDTFNGMRVQTSVWLTEPGDPVTLRRTWRERLFSWPWRPLIATRTVVPQVPKKGAISFAGQLLMHPETFRQLRDSARGPVR